MRTSLKPIDKASFGVFNTITVPRQWPVGHPAIQDKLHALDTTVEMRVEISSNSRIKNFVLLIIHILDVTNSQRVAEYSTG